METAKEIGSDGGKEAHGNGNEEGFNPSTFPDAECVGGEEEEGEAKRATRKVRQGMQAGRRQKAKGYQCSIVQEAAHGREHPVVPVFDTLNQDCGVNNMM